MNCLSLQNVFCRHTLFNNIALTFQFHSLLSLYLKYNNPCQVFLLHFESMSFTLSRRAVPFGSQTGLARVFRTRHTLSVQITRAAPVAWRTTSHHDPVGQGTHPTQNQESSFQRAAECRFTLCICCRCNVYYCIWDSLAIVRSTLMS